MFNEEVKFQIEKSGGSFFSLKRLRTLIVEIKHDGKSTTSIIAKYTEPDNNITLGTIDLLRAVKVRQKGNMVTFRTNGTSHDKQHRNREYTFKFQSPALAVQFTQLIPHDLDYLK